MESPIWPGFEPPASGPGPVTNRLRLRGGPKRGVSDPRQLVGDYTNPILKPPAAEFVKKRLLPSNMPHIGVFTHGQHCDRALFLRGCKPRS